MRLLDDKAQMQRLKRFLAPRQIEYLTLDENFHILELSWGIQRFADCPSAVVVGADVRNGFPELIGSEDCLRAILQGEQSSFELKGIFRFSDERSGGSSQNSATPREPIYIDLYAIREQNEKTSKNQLIIYTEDVTESMLLKEKLLQRANEANLLLSSLAASEDCLDKIITSMADALFVTNRTGTIKKINRAAQYLFGYSETELIGQPISKIIEDEHFLQQCFQHTGEILCLTKNKTEIFVSFSCSLIQGKIEDFPNFIYVGRDVTERKRAEEELRRQTMRSQLLTEITLKIRQSLQIEEILETTVTEVRELLQADRVLILRVLPDGTGSNVVKEAVVPNYPTLRGRAFLPEIFPPEYHAMYRQGRIQNIEDVENAFISPCHVEFLRSLGVKAKLVVPILQGEELWGLLIAHQCTNPRHWDRFEIELLQQLANQVGIALIAAQLVEAVQESEKQFRQLTENISEVFWLLNPNSHKILYISPAYEKVWGRSCESLYQQPQSWLDSIHPDDRLRTIAALEERMRGGKFFNEEYRVIRTDGSIRWIWAREFPICNESGEVYRIAGIGEDITERKNAESEMRNALEKEREFSELKSRFISMASHEFRTPLNIILLSSEMLENYSDKFTEAKKRQHFERIYTAVQNMKHLLEDVLTIGKAEANKLVLNLARLNPVEFCQELVNEMQLTAGKQHQINFISQGESNDAYFDEKILRQILANLLTNAIKYSSQGSNVYVSCCCHNEVVVFQVRDEGIGIPPEDREHLFETFHRATNVGDIPGTGLGMAIVKQGVDLHNGEISVESEVNVGTTFTVRLPVKLANIGNNQNGLEVVT